jgi:serine/threonine-protein kinase
MPLRIGETFAGYRILRLLGSGGMGEVYLVQHPRLPRHDALKVLRPDVSSDTSFRDRFIREADLAAGLRHPHIVAIHDRGEHDGQLWIAMDYIDGSDAAQLMQQRYPAGMPAELTIPIITGVASALDYAHKRGLLHRDVKAANIIVADFDSDDRRVFLADFGIARSLDDSSGITTTNMTVGTVAYAAPEQLMGEELDGRADQYALAATAYHLLTGVQLFPHSNPAVVISRHLNTTPPTLGDRRLDCACLDDVFQIALAKNPQDRFPSCSAFARALVDESPGQGAVSANATTRAAPTTRAHPRVAEPPTTALRARRLWLIAAAAATALVLAVATAIVWHPWQRNQSVPTAPTSPAPLPIPSNAPSGSPPSSSSPTASARSVALPDVPPVDAGCSGTLIAHHDIQHKTLGAVRVFLFRSTTRGGEGCIAAVASSGNDLPPMPITVDAGTEEPFGFANPATDATGNTFVLYNPGRYDGVLVLIPNTDGFENIDYQGYNGTNQHFSGKHAYYYAQLIGPGVDGDYTIRQSNNDCVPDCATGTITTQDLRWDGSDYVP